MFSSGVRFSYRRWVKVGLGASLIALMASQAMARGYYHPGHYRLHRAYASADAYNPAFSAIVVDANTGHEIYGVNEDAPRHPASITKVMTLYLLFEQLAQGRWTLDTPIRISDHAAAQEPSKLGIAAGDSLTTEEAIKAVVTRSANDVAVAIAEAIGGDESTFAEMMTRKAHALGMSRTLYRNASGLPNDEQWTTAHDLTVLARSLEERFPTYFRYFSTHEFVYDGEVIGNHNHLLGKVDGVDGIKTGYTRASGFNLLTSVHRDGRSLVAVVMGGRSAGARDRTMEGLIATHIAEASNQGHTATAIADNESPVEMPVALSQPRQPRVGASRMLVQQAQADEGEGDKSEEDSPAMAPSAPARAPLKVGLVPSKPFGDLSGAKDIKVRSETKTRAETRVMAEIKAKAKPQLKVADVAPQAKAGAVSSRPAPSAKGAAIASDDPAAHGWKKGPQGITQPAAPGKPQTAAEETRVARSEKPKGSPALDAWIIQIGAASDASKANALLTKAKAHSRALADARPFTEKYTKGRGSVFRARFSGLDQATAGQACKTLRRDGFECVATRLE